jgi:hypothetical protein
VLEAYVRNMMLGGVSNMWIIRHRQANGFPDPAFYAGGKKFYRLTDIEAWIETRSKVPPDWLKAAAERGRAAVERTKEARARKLAEAKPNARKPRPIKPRVAAE